MKKKQKTGVINFKIDLDSNNIPEKINWEATDSGNEKNDTKAVMISIWDASQKSSLKIDLWTKEMKTDEMKRFYIDCLGGLSQSILSSTGDEYMSKETNKLCDKLIEHIKNNSN